MVEFRICSGRPIRRQGRQLLPARPLPGGCWDDEAKRIGLLYPGEMGASVGAAARAAGHEVLWASEGRSQASWRRAQDAGIADAGTFPRLLEQIELVLGVVPPHAAVEVAEGVAARRYAGTYIDADVVAPATARQVRAIATAPAAASSTAASSAGRSAARAGPGCIWPVGRRRRWRPSSTARG